MSLAPSRAEGLWHLPAAALAVMILADHAEPGPDLLRTLQMVPIHDLVESDAGDTIAYADAADKAAQAALEAAAAQRLFGMLPAYQGKTLRGLSGNANPLGRVRRCWSSGRRQAW